MKNIHKERQFNATHVFFYNDMFDFSVNHLYEDMDGICMSKPFLHTPRPQIRAAIETIFGVKATEKSRFSHGFDGFPMLKPSSIDANFPYYEDL